MRYFCTYFDHRYLTRGLVLYDSLTRHCRGFKLWVLCLDDLSHRILQQLNLPNVTLITLEQFERDDIPLREAKSNRSRVEYYFTCTPSLPLYVFRNDATVDRITYLDADLCFFSDSAPMFEAINSHSIAIISHRFPPILQRNAIYGIYNVGLLSFRRDEDGMRCLRWWRDRCNEWCYNRLDEGRYGDQKYLDDWPTRFRNVTVLDHKGANLAVWNVANYRIGWNRRMVLVDDDPLVFYHFHGLTRLRSWLFDLNVSAYQLTPGPTLIRRVFAPYLRAVLRAEAKMRPLLQNSQEAKSRQKSSANTEAAHRPFVRRMRLKSRLANAIEIANNVLERNYVIVLNNRTPVLIPKLITRIRHVLRSGGPRCHGKQAKDIGMSVAKINNVQ